MNTTPKPPTHRQSFTISGRVLKTSPLKETARGSVPCFSFVVKADDPDVGFMVIRCGWLGEDAEGYSRMISKGDPIIVHGSLYLQPWIDQGEDGDKPVARAGTCLRVTEILTDVEAPETAVIDMDATVEGRTLIQDSTNPLRLAFKLRGVDGKGRDLSAIALVIGEEEVEKYKHIALHDRVNIQGPVRVLSRLVNNEVDCKVEIFAKSMSVLEKREVFKEMD